MTFVAYQILTFEFPLAGSGCWTTLLYVLPKLSVSEVVCPVPPSPQTLTATITVLPLITGVGNVTACAVSPPLPTESALWTYDTAGFGVAEGVGVGVGVGVTLGSGVGVTLDSGVGEGVGVGDGVGEEEGLGVAVGDGDGLAPVSRRP